MPRRNKSFSIMYKELFDNIPFGISYNRIIFTGANQPQNIEVLDTNTVFRQYTGFTKDTCSCVPFNELFQMTEKKWNSLLASLEEFIEKGSITPFEFYSEFHEKWFRTTYFHLREDHFFIVISDISRVKTDNENLRNIFDFSPDLIVTTDKKSMITDCNKKVVEVFGLPSKEALIGRSALELIIPAQREGVRDDMLSILTDGPLTGKVYTFMGTEGYFPGEMSANLIRDNYDVPFGYIGMVKDITERRLAEEALRKSEERFYKAFHSSPSCIAISTLDKGIYIEVNETFLGVFGYSREELVGISSLDLDMWIDNGSRPALVSELRSKGRICNRELKFRIKTGEVLIFLASLEKLDFAGEECIIFSLNDITARKKAEDELRSSEEKLRGIFGASPNPILVIDADKRILDCNNETLKMLEYSSKEDLIGKSAMSLIVPREYGFVCNQMQKLTEFGEINSCEITHVTSKGKEIITEASMSVLYNSSGELESIIIICRDISERKRAEAEIRYLSFHDKLTGLYNRAFFEEELNRLDTARQLPISLIIGDLNGLKLTNDVFGHYEGDKLLRKVAGILKNSCRKEDIIARWGGDEFALILPCTSNEMVLEICERISRSCIEAGKDPIQPSIALGYATKLEVTQDIQQVLKEAENWMYRHKLLENRSFRSSIISSLEKTLFEKSFETEEHAQRIRTLSIKLGNALKLSSAELDELSLLSILHDIGKIAISDNILTKPGKLSREEWDEMKKHPEVGYRIAESTKELSHIAEDILSHHERWDGTGYPRKLRNTCIPKLARIISVVDAYDVMTHSRPYKGIMTHHEALEEIERCAGTQFDPEIAGVFIKLMREET